MKRLAEITECDECPNKWMYLGLYHCCLLMNKRFCYNNKKDLDEQDDIPYWCPLPKVEDIGEPKHIMSFPKGVDNGTLGPDD